MIYSPASKIAHGMQERFDALCQRIETGFSGFSEADGLAEIAAAIAEDRAQQHSQAPGQSCPIEPQTSEKHGFSAGKIR
jgi:hypothetical protein